MQPYFGTVIVAAILSIVATGVGCISSDSKPDTDIMKYTARVTACKGAASRGASWVANSVALMKGLSWSDASFQAIVDGSIDCANKAGDCDAIMACVGPSAAEQETCEQKQNKSFCSGNRLVSCWPSSTWAPSFPECGLGGYSCLENAVGNVSCGLSVCKEKDPSHCESNTLIYCNTGSFTAYLKSDCAGLSGSCMATDTGSANCIGTGDNCYTDDHKYRTCSGSVISFCMGGSPGKMATFDCKSLGSDYTCLTNGTLDIYCGWPSNECGLVMPTCQDGMINFCYMGKVATLDCKAYGYSGCEVNAGVAICKKQV